MKCVPKENSSLICDPPCIKGTCVLNGTSHLGRCKCDPFYTGDTCDFYACHTFCFNKGICYVESGSTKENDTIAKVNGCLHLLVLYFHLTLGINVISANVLPCGRAIDVIFLYLKAFVQAGV